MTEGEFLQRSAALCLRIGKWPEWEPPGHIRRLLLVEDGDIDVLGCSTGKGTKRIWGLCFTPEHHITLCIMREFWRVWLEERNTDVSRKEGTFNQYYYTTQRALGTAFPDYNAAQIAAVEAVLAEEEGDGTA